MIFFGAFCGGDGGSAGFIAINFPPTFTYGKQSSVSTLISATARAVANLRMLGELCIPFVKLGGAMISMKSQQAEEELAEAKNCIAQCGGKLSEIKSCNLIDSSRNTEERKLIVIKKVKPTPQIYPRHFSKISKKPL